MKMKTNGALTSVKNTVLQSLNDMRRNNIEISLRFSWLDVMIAAMGMILFIVSLVWITKKCTSICSCRKKKSEQSDQN